MNRALLQQALDFCVFCWRDVNMNDYAFERLESTIDALRAELEKPEPEPYGWTVSGVCRIYKGDYAEKATKDEAARLGIGYKAIPLYTKGTTNA